MRIKPDLPSQENGLSRSVVTSDSRSFLRLREAGVLPDEILPPTPGRCNSKSFLMTSYLYTVDTLIDQNNTGYDMGQ